MVFQYLPSPNHSFFITFSISFSVPAPGGLKVVFSHFGLKEGSFWDPPKTQNLRYTAQGLKEIIQKSCNRLLGWSFSRPCFCIASGTKKERQVYHDTRGVGGILATVFHTAIPQAGAADSKAVATAADPSWIGSKL